MPQHFFAERYRLVALIRHRTNDAKVHHAARRHRLLHVRALMLNKNWHNPRICQNA